MAEHLEVNLIGSLSNTCEIRVKQSYLSDLVHTLIFFWLVCFKLIELILSNFVGAMTYLKPKLQVKLSGECAYLFISWWTLRKLEPNSQWYQWIKAKN